MLNHFRYKTGSDSQFPLFIDAFLKCKCKHVDFHGSIRHLLTRLVHYSRLNRPKPSVHNTHAVYFSTYLCRLAVAPWLQTKNEIKRIWHSHFPSLPASSPPPRCHHITPYLCRSPPPPPPPPHPVTSRRRSAAFRTAAPRSPLSDPTRPESSPRDTAHQ